MMKRSLDLSAEMGVNLRGVLTWAFTFPGTAYFAGYRALSTNGIHLPVFNAFKLLGSLSGDRLPLASTGAASLAEVLQNGFRVQPDVDALAAIGGDRVQILVWNYHDDLVDAPATSVTLDVALDSRFGVNALVTHTRVDETHGNAFTAWQAQGSPEPPSSAQLAELREAMAPALLEPERAVDVNDGTLRLAFGLPRHGISLFTIAPHPEDGAHRDDGCSCRLGASERPPHAPSLSLWLAALLLCRRGPPRLR
jgi:xylan 1,4-beta-xylosidase